MTLIVGHRGARNLWPENSLSGFRNLTALPVEAVEFDVHLSDAGELLVIHDPTLERTTDRTGPVRALPAGERGSVVLKGSEGEGIPTLEDVLEVFKDVSIELHVEIKSDVDHVPYLGLEARAAAALAAAGVSDRAFLTSFDPQVLRTVRRVAPHIRTLISFHRPSAERRGLAAGLEEAKEVAEIIAVEKSLLAAEWEAITNLVPRERLAVWTPNTEEELTYWLGKGLRDVTTDRPDIALAAREKIDALAEG
ncbi:glycerophosphodiester phosphodiesterase [Devosia geojensis]|uniref:Glycerophosphodiester phosphodiesterase n=1 Tax=Devosia geojensis TaxID=443610 RepID=A0A0F5FV87_9HYPH|nr:glycerophosphodiester phosphodiesterase family protein [Devosia geojensis]KKB12490.1 glycerophosphodiester phosphodiesterase [Devosia geojensis]